MNPLLAEYLPILIFLVMRVLPGDPFSVVFGQESFSNLSPADQARFRADLGLDQPFWSQYVDWLGGALQGDLGESLAQPGVPVWDIVEPALVNSLKLALFAFVLVVPLGILGGVLAGLRFGRLTDRSITVVGLSLAVVPEVVTGLVLLGKGDVRFAPPHPAELPAGTLVDLFLRAVSARRPRAQLRRTVAGWQPISHDEILRNVQQIAAARYGDHGYYIDGERRRIPDHWHAHARPNGGFFDPRSPLFGRT